MLRITTLICLGLSAFATIAQPGTLDPSFGTGGVVYVDPSAEEDVATDLLPLANGRLLVCGYSTPITNYPAPYILRLLPDGTLDPDYGIVTLPSSLRGRAAKMVFAPDSSVFVCGYADTLGYERFTLWHVLSDGTLDPTFGDNGRVSAPLTGVAHRRAQDIVMQTDGKLVLAGYDRIATRDSYLVRFNTDGTLDGTFGFGGVVAMENSSSANDEFLTVDVLDDGSIVAGGYGTSGGMAYPLIVKLSTTGVPDPAFDGDGILTPALSVPQSWVTCLAAIGQSVVASGARYTSISSTSNYFLIRFDDTGVLDPSFGTLGEEVNNVDADDFIRDLIILADDRIALAGYTGNMTNGSGYINFLAAVHTADGTPYTTFGGSGHAVGNFATPVNESYAIKAQADGKLVLCGVTNLNIGNPSATIVRYENDINTMVVPASHETSLMAWPNPANDQLRISLTNNGAAGVEILTLAAAWCEA
ncbi:MAG: hypothetical protein IPL52_07790 [Flavobacteriales bacterium]|nr:hypothetical protein [Flavobacteriales bacterium]